MKLGSKGHSDAQSRIYLMNSCDESMDCPQVPPRTATEGIGLGDLSTAMRETPDLDLVPPKGHARAGIRTA